MKEQLDPGILPEHLKKLVPKQVPSGSRTLTFEFDYSPFRLSGETAVAGEESTIPATTRLLQNFPNPFNPATTIRFAIPVGTYGRTSLRVFDMLGREVATLLNEEKSAGSYSVRWDATSVGSGTYFYRLESNGRREIRKMAFVR